MNPNNPYKLMMDTIQEAYGIIIPRKDQIELVKIYGKNYQQNLKYGYCKAGADEIASIYIRDIIKEEIANGMYERVSADYFE